MTTDEAKALGVRVKALDWEQENGYSYHSKAVGFKSVYRIRKSSDGIVVWQVKYMGEWIEEKSEEAAKAAAQADYTARIIAALEATT